MAPMRVTLRRLGMLLAPSCALGLALAGCGSTKNNGTPAGAGTESAAGTDASGGKGTAGSVSTSGASGSNLGGSGSGGDTPSGGSLNEAGAADAGAPSVEELTSLPEEMRRLTAAEYTATVTDVLGTFSEPDLAAFSTTVDGFDNNAAANGVNDALYLRYLETAEDLANEVYNSNTLRARFITCEDVDSQACVRQVINQTGLRLFRRPLVEDEIAAYSQVYTAARTRGLNHANSLREVLTALLASAQFIYRTEPVPTATGEQPISPYDLATRLSYLLWSSAPDDKLLQSAAQNALATDDQLDAEVSRLLAEPRADRFAQNFAGQWLGTRLVPTLTFDPTRYPSWSPQLASAVATELTAYFDELVAQDADWLTFLSSPTHFVNATLAPVYGLNVQGATTQRVELAGQDRQGFLGLAAFLAQTSVPNRTSPLKRGSWILERLLCSPVPPSPPGTPTFAGGEESMRSYLDGLGATCHACHSLAGPPGLALENYDAIGRYRTTYQNGAPIDAAETLVDSPSLPAAQVSGVKSLSDAVAKAPAFKTCTAQKVYTYGLGRSISADDGDNVPKLTSNWEGGPLTMRALVSSLVKSKAFRMRSDGGSL